MKTSLLLLALCLSAGPLAAGPAIPVLNWEKRSDWVSVKTDVAPPAVGDGLADDTAAIQKALDGVHSGSTVYLPAGTYRISNALAIRGKGVYTGVLIVGHGRETKLVWDGKQGGRCSPRIASPIRAWWAWSLTGEERPPSASATIAGISARKSTTSTWPC